MISEERIVTLLEKQGIILERLFDDIDELMLAKSELEDRLVDLKRRMTIIEENAFFLTKDAKLSTKSDDEPPGKRMK